MQTMLDLEHLTYMAYNAENPADSLCCKELTCTRDGHPLGKCRCEHCASCTASPRAPRPLPWWVVRDTLADWPWRCGEDACLEGRVACGGGDAYTACLLPKIPAQCYRHWWLAAREEKNKVGVVSRADVVHREFCRVTMTSVLWTSSECWRHQSDCCIHIITPFNPVRTGRCHKTENGILRELLTTF